jgi:pyruvate formate lyase activating enzyme
MKKNTLSESPGGTAVAPGKIPVGGFLKQSLVDYPGHITAVIFTQGCNFRCVYCHNPELIPPTAPDSDPEAAGQILGYIRNYRHLLDAVTITGGEPTLHPNLPSFIREIRNNGVKVKLDTNGTAPEMLSRLLHENLLDYVAMDIKAPLETEKYRAIAGKQFNDTIMEKVRRSVEILKHSRIDYEFRTTLVRPYHSPADIRSMIRSLSGKYFLQRAEKSGKTLTDSFDTYTFTKDETMQYLKENDPIITIR